MISRITTIACLVVVGSAVAEPDKKRVNAAISAGRDFLRAVYRPGGPGPLGMGPGGMIPGAALMGPVGGTGNGKAALAGLALLECGAGPRDEAVSNIALAVRGSALKTNSTYEISLFIMFLDRLGSPADEGLIQFLTLRLISGQTADGSWGYSCNGIALNEVEERQLYAELVREAKMATPDGTGRPTPKKKDTTTRPREDLEDKPKTTPKKDEPKKETEPEAPKEEKPRGLHPALEKFKGRPTGPGGFGVGQFGTGDHSNTQFATVGLWCGRRHFVDVNAAMADLDKHYRNCQQAGGGWAYTSALGNPSPSMTCAGLMGLALGFGARNLKDGGDRAPRLEDPEALGKDQIVMAGLKYVGDFIAAAHDNGQQNDLSRDLYFMWSLERVGMVYGLETIGKVDWYDWGANILTRSQNRDGSWQGDVAHSGGLDSSTAFALLFLSRANLASDLTDRMKGKVKDPGTSRLVRGNDLDKLLKDIGSGSTGSRRTDGGSGSPAPRPDPTPPAKADLDAGGRLANALISSGAGERDDLIAKYRDTKGGEYTDAMARAANKLTGDAQAKVRDALAQRMTRMTANTLNECMRDRDRELRRAAALATASKGKERFPEFADSLIRLIGDDEAMVIQAARSSLKTLTDQDFGPESGSLAADRGKAMLAWKAWWETHRK